VELSFVGEVNDHREERAKSKMYYSPCVLDSVTNIYTKTQMTFDLYQIRKSSQGKTAGRERILYKWLVFLHPLGAAALILCVGFFPR
jgi:hypothetical protein